MPDPKPSIDDVLAALAAVESAAVAEKAARQLTAQKAAEFQDVYARYMGGPAADAVEQQMLATLKQSGDALAEAVARNRPTP